MPRADGRIEPGQKLTSAISARAWNRAQQAADIVLGNNPGFAAGPTTTATLPCLKATLNRKGYFGEAFYLQGVLGLSNLMSPSAPAGNSSPDNSSLAAFSEGEKKLVSVLLPPTTQNVDYGNNLFRSANRICICIGNDSLEYAISGFAITRIRVFNYKHRHARWPVPYPDETSSDAEKRKGCLDSAFWGPAAIVGYFTDNAQLTIQDNTPFPFPEHEFRWALVQL